MVQAMVPRLYCTAESPHRLMARPLAQSSVQGYPPTAKHLTAPGKYLVLSASLQRPDQVPVGLSLLLPRMILSHILLSVGHDFFL